MTRAAPIDVDRLRRLRADTPGVAHRNHLNNAGAGLMPAPVLDAITDHLRLEAEHGGYEAAAERAGAVEAVYEELAGLIGTGAHNIAITENATAAFVQALSAFDFQPGDTLLTSRSDYTSNQIQYLSLQRRTGVEILYAPERETSEAGLGGIDPEATAALVHRKRPRLVAISQIPTSSGLVQELGPVGVACKEREVPFLVDACQSVGQMTIDVEALGCDFLAATGRKFLRGPRGIGFLFVSDRMLDRGAEPLYIDLRGADWIAEDLYQPAPDAKRFENWEFAYALVLGLGAAACYLRTEVGVEAARVRAWALAGRLRERLGAIPGVRVLDRGDTRCAIVTASVEGRAPGEVSRRLREEYGINTSWQAREAAVLDFDAKGVDGIVRVSPHYYNTEEEIDEAVEAFVAIATGSDVEGSKA